MHRITPGVLARAALGLAALLLIAGCGSSDGGDADAAALADATNEPTATVAQTEPASATESETTTAGTSSDAPISSDSWDTTAGVQAAQWGDNVTVTLSDGGWRFESNGIPNHELPDQFLVPQTGSFTPPVTVDEVTATDASVAVVESPVDQMITLSPIYSSDTTKTSLGIIGVTISGAQLFNDYEDQDRSFVAVDDNFSVDGIFFVDSCNGHPLALLADGTGGGNYHYHGVPYCLTDIIDVEGEHSSVLGFLVDGFPFYGPQDAGGVTITSDELDTCSGHVGATPEFPDGIYHYHLTEDRSPYTVDCYHGQVVASASVSAAPGAADGAGAPDFSDSAATLGVSAEDLESALGQPPFDLDAAAAALGIDVAELEAALPAPPGG